MAKASLAGDKWLNYGRQQLRLWTTQLSIPLLAGEAVSSLQVEVKVRAIWREHVSQQSIRSGLEGASLCQGVSVHAWA